MLCKVKGLQHPYSKKLHSFIKEFYENMMIMKRTPLLLLLTILLISCAGAKYKKIVPSELKTLDDFSKAKDQLADNYLYKAHDFDLNVVNYAAEYIFEAKEIIDRLSAFDSNLVLLSVEESELLTLALISKGETLDSTINPFLLAIVNHNSNIEKQKTKEILNGYSTKTKRSLAEGIHFFAVKDFIQECSCSSEEKEIMLLYAQFLLIKYKFRFRQELYNIDEFEAFDNGDKWLDKNKKKFLKNHPNTKYRSFLESITIATTEK